MDMDDTQSNKRRKLVDDLAALLVRGMLNSPELINELPPILIALETKKSVDVTKLSTAASRETVEQLYAMLPLISNEWGTDLSNIRKLVLHQLLHGKHITNPKQLLPSESLACRNAPLILIEMVQRFPDIKGELDTLLASIEQQECEGEVHSSSSISENPAVQKDCVIDLNGIGDEDLQEYIGRLLKALGLLPYQGDADDCDDVEFKYVFPSRTADKQARITCKQAIGHFRQIFKIYLPVSSGDGGSSSGGRHSSSSSKRRARSPSESRSEGSSSNGSDSCDAGTDSDSGSDGGGDSEDSGTAEVRDEPQQTRRVVGPSMPPPEALRMAVASREAVDASSIGPAMPPPEVLARLQQQREEEDSDDDDIGPKMYVPSAAPTSSGSREGGFAGGMDGVDANPLGGEIVKSGGASAPGGVGAAGGRASSSASSSVAGAVGQQREEWMMTPGSEGDPFGGPGGGGDLAATISATLVNKGFQSGKQAKKAAEALEARKKFEREEGGEREMTAEERETAEMLQKYREQRGPSLMDMHTTAKGAGKGGSSSSSRGGKGHGGYKGSERKAFDREEDVLSHRKMTSKDAQEMVKQARGLDDRFSKGSVQKHF